MQTPTTQIVDQAIAKSEAEDAKIVDDPKNDKGTNDVDKKQEPAKDADADKSKSGEDDGKPADKEPAKPKYDKDGKRIEEPAEDEKVEKEPEEGKFTADDAKEIEEKPAEPSTPTDNAGIQLSPQESKYIADNIGEPIVIRGVRGDGENAKEVEIKAYSPADIPADFKFANDQQLAAASTGFQNLERKANDLLGNFRQSQSNTAAQDFERRENEGIRQDVAELQKDGRFPKFTVRPGDEGFDESPEAQQMAEVLNIMSEKNQMYLKQYEQGRPYKHIGFSEAFIEWESKNPERQKAKKADADQAKEDEERKTRAPERSDSNRGMNPSNIVKPTVRPGTTTRDILNRIDNEDFLTMNENSINFSDALEELKNGKAIYRSGWNAGGQYVYLVRAGVYPAVTDIAKAEFGKEVPYGPYLAIKTVQHNVVPWLASQTDLLADDWLVLETKKES